MYVCVTAFCSKTVNNSFRYQHDFYFLPAENKEKKLNNEVYYISLPLTFTRDLQVVINNYFFFYKIMILTKGC